MKFSEIESITYTKTVYLYKCCNSFFSYYKFYQYRAMHKIPKFSSKKNLNFCTKMVILFSFNSVANILTNRILYLLSGIL